MTMFLNIEWIAGLPQYRDVTYLLRDTTQPRRTALCCWDSTSDVWTVQWMDGTEERFADPEYDRGYPEWPETFRVLPAPRLETCKQERT